jgi:hypothetical protein
MKRALIIFTLAIFWGQRSSHALEGYQDRRGFFAGAGIGGGGVMDQKDQKFGIRGQLNFGGGVSQDMLLDLVMGFWHFSLDKKANFIFTPGIEMSYFVHRNLFLKLGVSMGWRTWEENKKDKSKLGMGFGLGTGAEFFMSSSTAFGVGLDYKYHVYPDIPDLHFIGLNANIKWY